MDLCFVRNNVMYENVKFSEKYENELMADWFISCKKSIRQLKSVYRNGTLPYRSFLPKVVEFIFKVAEDCHMENTVKYRCVELYDRFLSKYFIHLHKDDYNNDFNEWQRILDDCKKLSCLRVLSCMQLMSKYTLQWKRFRLKDVKRYLKRTGYNNFSRKQILSSEAEVFHIVDYKLNEPTLFMLVEFFIQIFPFNVTEELYSTCILVTDFVYINHQELFDKLQYRTEYINNTYTEKSELLNIEYDKITTAAVVVLSAFSILDSTDIKNEELCEYLSELCENSSDILFMISSILISMIN